MSRLPFNQVRHQIGLLRNKDGRKQLSFLMRKPYPASGWETGHKNGLGDGSVAIRRTGFYSVHYDLLPLAAVAGKARVMEDEFIAPSGTDVTDAFRMYLRPLLGSGMPDAFRLRHHPVAKVLQRGG